MMNDKLPDVKLDDNKSFTIKDWITAYTVFIDLESIPSSFKLPTEFRADVPDNPFGIKPYLSKKMAQLYVFSKAVTFYIEDDDQYKLPHLELVEFFESHQGLLDQLNFMILESPLVVESKVIEDYYAGFFKDSIYNVFKRNGIREDLLIESDINNFMNSVVSGFALNHRFEFRPIKIGGTNYTVLFENSRHVIEEREYERSLNVYKYTSSIMTWFHMLELDMGYKLFLKTLKVNDEFALVCDRFNVTIILVSIDVEKYGQKYDMKDTKKNKNVILRVKTMINKGKECYLDDRIKKVFYV